MGRLLRNLVAEGLLDPEAALAGDVLVMEISRSNTVGLISVAQVPRLVLKLSGAVTDGQDPFLAEAAAYRWLRSAPALCAIAPRLLRVVAADRILVLEAISDSRPLHELSDPAVVEAAIVELGRLLSMLHSAPTAGASLTAVRPWVLDLPAGRVPAALSGDELVEEVVSRVVGHDALREALTSLAEAWAPRTPVHGDLKFDNVLVAISGRGLRAWLVDWELAGLGEPAWDLAGIADGALVPQIVQGRAADVVEAARLMDISLGAYLAGRGSGDAPANLASAVLARLVQSAVQLAAMRHTIPLCGGQARRVVDVAIALSERPIAWGAVGETL